MAGMPMNWRAASRRVLLPRPTMGAHVRARVPPGEHVIDGNLREPGDPKDHAGRGRLAATLARDVAQRARPEVQDPREGFPAPGPRLEEAECDPNARLFRGGQ